MNNTKREELKELGFDKEVQRYENGQCTICGTPQTWDMFSGEDFKVIFRQSGTCQVCMKKIEKGELG